MYLLILLLASYLIGSFPTALIIGKVFYGIDIRKHGSNNPGATNSIRVLGKKAGIAVLLLDVGKGALAASLPYLLMVDVNPLYTGLIAVVGHCFPIFAGFRGGKAIATTAGTLLVANPALFLISYFAFFAIIIITKYVFLGSISVGITIFLYALFSPDIQHDWLFFLFLLLLIFLHRSNIINFIHHKEPKVNDKNVKKDRINPKKIV
ncbi:glycerol-3-phosphate 1-O-acyltransferase PlsY [Bacillus sp. PK3-056]|jgi:acyl phosphate:glycerol-3-phosphate acyltransferase|uniref:glycerol-3-phosphate 1-O-acyltransferase PlsY n=1 Tax=Niallia TaxID=2837506 RepID=UPI0013DE2449|nr:glycerol-3-phosphate 1-O-acyltransferase PlsY [Niallia circulans]QJX60729.1 glycerol-3-phosphate 1-O-acyltransferase PlsY [Niallia circulans]